MDREDKSGILDGAIVNPAFKGKGIYKAMIAKRPHDARENGLEYLINTCPEENICSNLLEGRVPKGILDRSVRV